MLPQKARLKAQQTGLKSKEMRWSTESNNSKFHTLQQGKYRQCKSKKNTYRDAQSSYLEERIDG